MSDSLPNLFLSTAHECSYLPDRAANTLFMDPRFPLSTELFGDFNRRGFRRSGDLIYRPHCQGCHACVPVRIPVESFMASRAQRRTLLRNRDVRMVVKRPVFDNEHFALFLRYQNHRHTGGSMANPDPPTYMRFLVGQQVETLFYEFRADGRLLAVAVIDSLPDGLSAVYTFYEPDLPQRGLGTFSILSQVRLTHELGLPFLYLGYWIEASPKMAYKSRFQPLEGYRNGRWARLSAESGPAS
ncbi:MAG: arginyltransferase [Gammaproteobacteria bacterium]|nr:arginyltransferase [Gammaproteobacteria bacterium]